MRTLSTAAVEAHIAEARVAVRAGCRDDAERAELWHRLKVAGQGPADLLVALERAGEQSQQ